MADIKGMIELTRQLFYQKRMLHVLFDRKYMHLSSPAELPPTDSLRGIYKVQNSLYVGGRIVFGFIVQANDLLFSPGEYDCPAVVVFSEDGYFDCHLDELRVIAYRTYALKGVKRTKRAFQPIADMLANECGRYYNIKLPTELSDGKDVYMTTVMVHRRHLPVPLLVSSWFPLLILPEKTKYSILLASKYWSNGMISEWTDGLKDS